LIIVSAQLETDAEKANYFLRKYREEMWKVGRRGAGPSHDTHQVILSYMAL